MSKRLEELGISPAPWKYIGYHDHKNGEYIHLGEVRVGGGKRQIVVDISQPDAAIMSAAPELYDAGQKTEAVLDKLFGLEEFAALLKSGAADALIVCRDKLRDALAKASGEAAK